MRLVIQVPCLNEEKTLPLVLESIPGKIDGVDEIIILVIDDGSSDKTVEVAKKHGVKEIVRHTSNRGLGVSFQDGVNRALEIGADILVNTDGDNQYPQAQIGELIKPIIDGVADIVIADRQVDKIAHFSKAKKILQKVGSRVVNIAATTNVPDAASGFRAYSKESLIQLNVTARFSYTMETIIQAGNKKLAIVSVPVETNPKTRESRLFKSTPEHIAKSSFAIIRSYIMYRPYMIFIGLAIFLFLLCLIPFVRYYVFFLEGRHGQHVQSLLLGVALLLSSVMAVVLGVIADLIRINRILNEASLEHLKRIRFSKNKNLEQ